MRGRRLRKTGGVFAGIRRGFFGAENNADAWPSFAAVEESMSDRLQGLHKKGAPVRTKGADGSIPDALGLSQAESGFVITQDSCPECNVA